MTPAEGPEESGDFASEHAGYLESLLIRIDYFLAFRNTLMIFSRANWIALLAVGTFCLFYAAQTSQAEIISPPVLSFTSYDGTTTSTWGQTGKAFDLEVFTYNGATTKSSTKYAWNITANPDPWVSSNYTITNNTLSTNNYSVTITLPISPQILTGSLTGGSVQGGVTDNNGNGATLGQSGVLPLYTALIDGVAYQSLLPPGPTSVTVGSFLSGTLGPAQFGLPIPSQPGPNVLTSIGIRLDFSLTPGDSATFSSVFVVEPVPESATMALASCGFALIFGGAYCRRRNLRRKH